MVICLRSRRCRSFRNLTALACWCLFLATAAAGCARPTATEERSAGTDGARRSAVPVATALVVVKAVPVTIGAVGVVEALSKVEVRAQVSGQLSGVHFSEGEEVGEGRLLFSLDPRPFRASLEEAQAVLARDIAQANNATAQSARYDNLFRRGLI